MSTALRTEIESKIMTLEEAVLWREKLKKERKRLVLTNGCFDLMHRGHAEYMLDARSCGDALIVLLNADSSVRALKGPTRPVCSEKDRAFLLASLEAVDAVVIFSSPRATHEMAMIRPDVYVKGGDYTIDKLDPEERTALQACGAEFCFKPFVPGLSTSSLIRKIQSERNPLK